MPSPAPLEKAPIRATTMIAKESESTSHPAPSSTGARQGLARDPLSSDDILTGFYLPDRSDWPKHGTGSSEPEVAKPRPTQYKVICISLYNEDIDRLEGLVRELKRRGHSKANKSQVIREALLQIDLDKVPRHH